MKNLVALLISIFICGFSIAQVNTRSHYVNGYYKSNGTYVNGYYRTNPNHTKNDNYSTYPNNNPYTGKQGNVRVKDNELTNFLNSYSKVIYTIDNSKLYKTFNSLHENDLVIPKSHNASHNKTYGVPNIYKRVIPQNIHGF